MKNNLPVLICFFSLICCGRKNMPVSGKVRDIDKKKEFVRSPKIAVGKASIDMETNVSPDTLFKFSSAEEATNYFKNCFEEIEKVRRVTCLDTLIMLSRHHSRYYDPYLTSLKARARQAMKMPIPGYNYDDTLLLKIPVGYEFLLLADSTMKPAK